MRIGQVCKARMGHLYTRKIICLSNAKIRQMADVFHTHLPYTRVQMYCLSVSNGDDLMVINEAVEANGALLAKPGQAERLPRYPIKKSG